MFIRVKDKDSGHEFDVSEHDWRIEDGSLIPVKSDRYPLSPVARLPKYNVSPDRATTTKKES
jgi:hypothetical protein